MQAKPREPCPACGQDQEQLVHLVPSTIDHLLADVVRQRNPSWEPAMGICRRCLDRRAATVALGGGWNAWSPDALPFEQGEDGHWELDLPIPPPGEYRYKIVVDGATWRCDPRNLHREPDGLDGFNSTFIVE